MQKLHQTAAPHADIYCMSFPEQSHASRRGVRRFLAIVCVLGLTSCEAMKDNWARNSAFWNSPQGQMALTQSLQQQQALNQQNYQFQQTQLLRQQQMHTDVARSMQPVRVEHSGTVEVQHSGSIRVRR